MYFPLCIQSYIKIKSFFPFEISCSAPEASTGFSSAFGALPILFRTLDVKLIYYHSVLYLGDQIKKAEMDRACSTYGGGDVLIGFFVGETEGRRSLGKHKLRWECNIKTNLRKVDLGRVHGLDRSSSR
jgi:hypothetical protein